MTAKRRANTNQMSFNGTQIFTNAATGSAGPLWDNLTTDVSAYVAPGASQVTASSAFGTDAITFSAVVFSTTVQDTDGDGLLDIWETNGYTDMTDGSFINLPAMGANPNVKDIFVEIDYMVAAGHSHAPKPAAIAKIVAGFQGALGGAINIHFDYGQGGLYTGGNAITEVLPTQWKWDTAQSPGFLTIKNANFNRNRRHIFHYSLWAHQRPDHPDPRQSRHIGSEFRLRHRGLSGKRFHDYARTMASSGLAGRPGGHARRAGRYDDARTRPQPESGTRRRR